jgi:hypothetical protein
VARIERLRGGVGIVDDRPKYDRPQQDRSRREALPKDPLQKVSFDFAEAYGRAEEASFMPYIRRQLGDMGQSSGPIVEGHRREVLQCEVLEFGPPRELNRSRRWLSGGTKAKALGTGTNKG